MLEQYVTKLNIEAETAAAIAKTMLLPAAARHLALLLERPARRARLRDRGADQQLVDAIKALESANLEENQPDGDILKHAEYMRDTTIPAMSDGPRGRRHAGEGRGRRPVAAAEVLGDPVRQVGRIARGRFAWEFARGGVLLGESPPGRTPGLGDPPAGAGRRSGVPGLSGVRPLGEPLSESPSGDSPPPGRFATQRNLRAVAGLSATVTRRMPDFRVGRGYRGSGHPVGGFASSFR